MEIFRSSCPDASSETREINEYSDSLQLSVDNFKACHANQEQINLRTFMDCCTDSQKSGSRCLCLALLRPLLQQDRDSLGNRITGKAVTQVTYEFEAVTSQRSDTLHVHSEQRLHGELLDGAIQTKTFENKFDFVLSPQPSDDASTEDVTYLELGTYVTQLIEAKTSVTLICYGQTCSGKTFSSKRVAKYASEHLLQYLSTEKKPKILL